MKNNDCFIKNNDKITCVFEKQCYLCTMFAKNNIININFNNLNDLPIFSKIQGGLDLVNKQNIDYPVFDGFVTVKSKNSVFLKNYEAVYFFHDLRGIHYVGETTNLKLRYTQHIEKEKNKDLKEAIASSFGPMFFSWVKAKSKVDALRLQKKWIRLLKPSCNNIKYKSTT